MMLIVSMPFQDNVLLTYIAGCIGATVLEYVLVRWKLSLKSVIGIIRIRNLTFRDTYACHHHWLGGF